ncbi:MAG: MG2 domain-containing protein, partial [Kiritimatiellae bacterium]|nr:MG2 domain-containing protein [Kiritimatiellia bacterium]
MLANEGNWAEALDVYKQALDQPVDSNPQVVQALHGVHNCLNRLNRISELDTFVATVVSVHSNDWRMLSTTASILNSSQHYGYMIAGEYQRGQHRGGGKAKNSYLRDRHVALSLKHRAHALAREHATPREYIQECQSFAHMFRYVGGYHQSWRLLYMTDFDDVPDYDDGHYFPGHGRTRGAPSHADGEPVFHTVPTSFDAARTDGERWRWLLEEVRQASESGARSVRRNLADFAYQEFGVQTMASYGRFFDSGDADDDEGTSGPYAVHTLRDAETIARLASGVKRFNLPDDYNYIAHYKALLGDGNQLNLLQKLATIYENRRQYPAAAACRRQIVDAHGPGHKDQFKKALDQIIKPWARFEPVVSQPAGKGATVDFQFRNGKEVAFKAEAIDVEALLRDVRAYLKSNPRKLDHHRINIGDIGYRLLEKNQRKYLKGRVAKWDLPLKPRASHFDRRLTVATPLQDAGAYFLTARIKGGNTSHIIIWLSDTVIVRKPLDKSTLVFVADARTGAPIPDAELSFFGYQQRYVDPKLHFGRRYTIDTESFERKSDRNGLWQPEGDSFKENNRLSWMITARQGERFAYHGFMGAWYGNYYDHAYNQVKPYVVTDRPVYRPAQTVNYKVWLRRAQYDQDDVSQFANATVTARLYNPQNEKVAEVSLNADAYGGINSDYLLPDGAALGVYRFEIVNYGNAQATFRVEEYKKPEFQVSIDAPSEPVALGEKVTATINARYYFGAPVTDAKVTYKVKRQAHSAQWYPVGRWDWFYNPGYWWFAYDCEWYPGWHQWGCRAPWPWWQPRQPVQPEIVAEQEVEIGADGTVSITFDTGPAKAMHGDQDHRYEITAEVVDASRRTITGRGSVLVARRPFKVYVWVDRGHYRVGDTVLANFSAQTLDQKPVAGDGRLRLFRVTYDRDGTPSETLVEKWDLPTNQEGQARQQLSADKSGQYRLSFTVTDAAKHEIEGGYVFTVVGNQDDGRGYRFNALELITDKREYAPGDAVQLKINRSREGGVVLLFDRAANGICKDPRVLRLDGKSMTTPLRVTKRDMPNFFVEALTVSDGKVHTEIREIIVPPEKRVLNVEVVASTNRYAPGEDATVKIKITDHEGKPSSGACAVSVYDKSDEYISGGSNVPEIREFFWKWRRTHRVSLQSSLSRVFQNRGLPKEATMGALGAFGNTVFGDDVNGFNAIGGGLGGSKAMRSNRSSGIRGDMMLEMSAAPMAASLSVMSDSVAHAGAEREEKSGDNYRQGADGSPAATVEPTVRTEF